MASCFNETPVPEAEQQVEITLTAGTNTGPVTRATDSGSKEDRYVNSLRVLGFRSVDGKLAFNNLIFYNNAGKVEGFTGKIRVLTGRYTLVLIANEHADTSRPASATMYSKLESLELDVTTIDDLGNLWFASGRSFDTTKDIPMIARVDNVKITPSGAAGNPLPGTTNLGDPLRITLRRLAVRLDITIRMYPEQVDAWWDTSRGVFYVEGIPSLVYLFPRDNSNPSNRSTWGCTVRTKPTAVDADGLVSIDFPRIILPEALFSPATNKNLSVSVSLSGGNITRRGTIAIGGGASAPGYTLPRNNYLKVTATAKPDALDIETEAMIEGWDDEQLPQDI
jgi:hypothetical protein